VKRPTSVGRFAFRASVVGTLLVVAQPSPAFGR